MKPIAHTSELKTERDKKVAVFASRPMNCYIARCLCLPLFFFFPNDRIPPEQVSAHYRAWQDILANLLNL